MMTVDKYLNIPALNARKQTSESVRPKTRVRCEIVAFPLSSQVAKIRRTVEALVAKQGRAAEQYWKQTVAGARAEMEAAQIDEVSIRRELRNFADVVFRTIDACHHDR